MAAAAPPVPKPKCRCCPYGFHIDLDFVNFAEDVVKGQSRTGRTPTLPRKAIGHHLERTLTSPLDSIFSDSLENIMSDFEDVLDRQNFFEGESFRSHANGYQSDYTGYRGRPVRATSPTASRQSFARNNGFPLDLGAAPPKPAVRPAYSNGARAQIQKGNTAYTALGRTISEIKARQSMETLVEQSPPSRLSGTTIDLGLVPPPTPVRHSARSEQEFLPPKSPRNESSGLAWRRSASTSAPQPPVAPPPDPERSGSAADTREFASLRRGRDAVPVSNGEGGTRVRYYSASPKLPRRLVAAPPLQNSNFTYSSSQNGQTILSRNQATSMSPRGEQLHIHTDLLSPTPPKPPPRESRSISVGTGPLPPAKPCIECPNLRVQLRNLAENPPVPPKPSTATAASATDPPPTLLDACVGAEKLVRMSIGIGTEAAETKEAETQGEKPSLGEKESQTTKIYTTSIAVEVQPSMKSIELDTSDLERREKAHFGVNTEGEFVPAEPSVPIPQKEFNDGSTQSERTLTVEIGCGESTKTVERETMTARTYYRSFPTQTAEKESKDMACSPVRHLLDEYVEQLRAQLAASSLSATCSQSVPPLSSSPSTSNAEAQTELEAELLHELSEPRLLADGGVADSLWLVPEKSMADAAVGRDSPTLEVGPIPQECETCLKREQTFTRNVGVGACSVVDKVCASCDEGMGLVDENEVPGFGSPPPPAVEKSELTRASATKKLLEQKSPFQRGTAVSRSCRLERKKNSDDQLEYIEQQHNKAAQKEHSPTPATVPSVDVAEALTAKVVLKKEVPPPPSKLPDPIPARIPRPKISKYAVAQGVAETPDEADEAADRLTPLRSELRSLGRWGRSSWDEGPQREAPLKHSCSVPKSFKLSDIWAYGDSEEEQEDSDGSEGTYDCQENDAPESSPFELSAPLREALNSLNAHLHEPSSVTAETADWALKYVQHEWLKTAAKKGSLAAHVEVMLETLKELGPTILKTVVNMTDQNGNSALHYAVSHGNFSVVSCLLDCGECLLNLANKAGYTPVMLAALSNLEDEVEKAVVHRLFQAGDVNARAMQHGQTALMLAVSHGKKETTQLLLDNEADVNIQDEEGSTALMCAAEHGHRELVKLLLAQSGVNAALTDCDSSTALSIAVENGHRDIGVLIYAHLNYARADSVDEP